MTPPADLKGVEDGGRVGRRRQPRPLEQTDKRRLMGGGSSGGEEDSRISVAAAMGNGRVAGAWRWRPH